MGIAFFAIIAIIAVLAIAIYCENNRWKVRAALCALTTPPVRVTITRTTTHPRRQKVDGYQQLLREAEWRDLEGEALLQKTLQSDDELAEAYLASLEARNRAA